MVAKDVVIKSKHGLHARPSAKISEYANEMRPTEIRIVDPKSDRCANARSILTMLTLGLPTNTEVKVEAEGPKEKEAVDEVARIIEEFDV